VVLALLAALAMMSQIALAAETDTPTVPPWGMGGRPGASNEAQGGADDAVAAQTPAAAPGEAAAQKATAAPDGAAAAGAYASPAPDAAGGDARQGRLAGMLIGIDPGHQDHANRDKEPLAPGSSEMKKKVSSGTQGVKTRINEYETNLIVALQLRDRLEAEGARVIMTRETNDVDISNVERALMMNEANVDIWLRVHCNGNSKRNVHGMSMYVRDGGPCAEESYAAGELLLEEMSAATGAKARGVHRSDNYSGNNWSERPCVLVEMGYMTNPEEDVLLNDPDYQRKLIEGYVNALERWNDMYNGLHIVQPECDGVM
jgi:N-acetylmuramoyl-L-alanine amidase